jgi:hypothetical protein
MRHTKSSDTMYNEAVQILIRWCRANRLPQAGPLPRRSVAGASPGILSMKCSCPDVRGVADALPHDVPRST